MNEISEQNYVDTLERMNSATEGGLTEEQQDIFRNSCGAAGSFGFISGIQFAQKAISISTDAVVEKFADQFTDKERESIKWFSSHTIRMLEIELDELMDRYEKNMNSAFPEEVATDA